jgi:hypothetical protein
MAWARIGRHPEDNDFWLCICGNHFWRSGFYHSLADGREVFGMESTHLCCRDCGRIIDPKTLEVVGMAGENLAV